MDKRVGSWFTGGGLFDIGAEMAGYKSIWGLEYDDKIAAVARLNGLPVDTFDIRKITKRVLKKYPRPNHFHCSPPCPSFSNAKQGGVETENDLQLADAVCMGIEYYLPDTFTLENVPAYVHSESWRRISETLQKCGYFVEAKNLNAADYGTIVSCPIHDIPYQKKVVEFAAKNYQAGIDQAIAGVLAMTSSEGQLKHLARIVADNLVRAILLDTAASAAWHALESAGNQEKKTLIGRAESILTTRDMSKSDIMEDIDENIALLLKECLVALSHAPKLSIIKMETSRTILLKILKCLTVTESTCNSIMQKEENEGCPLCEFQSVPQTRNRFWVRASKGLLMQLPDPVPWKGWFDAIEDLIPELEETQFAPWQIARLPEEYKSIVMSSTEMRLNANTIKETDEPIFTIKAQDRSPRAFITQPQGHNPKTTRGKIMRDADEPTHTILTNNNKMKAFIMQGGGNTSFAEAEEGKGMRFEDEPTMTMTTAEKGGTFPRAFFVDGQPNDFGKSVTVRDGDSPMFTTQSSAEKKPTRAFVLNGGNANSNTFMPRNEDEPHHTVTAAGDKTPSRAFVGRVVKMNIKCLGRFQCVPDWYQGLTPKINGNGVPVLLAKIIMETM